MPTTTIPAALAAALATPALERVLGLMETYSHATLHAIGHATDVDTADGYRVAALLIAATRALGEAADALIEAGDILGL